MTTTRSVMIIALIASALPLSSIGAQSASGAQTFDFALGPAWRVADYRSPVASLGGTIQVGWLNPVNDRDFVHLSYHYSLYNDASGAYPATVIVSQIHRFIARNTQRTGNSQQLSLADADPHQGDRSYEFSGEFRRFSASGQSGAYGAVGLGLIGQHDASYGALGISWSPVASVSAGYAWAATPANGLFVEARPTYAIAGSDEPRWSVSFVAGVSRAFGRSRKE